MQRCLNIQVSIITIQIINGMKKANYICISIDAWKVSNTLLRLRIQKDLQHFKGRI